MFTSLPGKALQQIYKTIGVWAGAILDLFTALCFLMKKQGGRDGGGGGVQFLHALTFIMG